MSLRSHPRCKSLSGKMLAVTMLLWLPVLAGCHSSYCAPGRAADFRAMGITPAQADAMTEPAMAERLALKPLAGFPTSIAIAHVQDAGYRSYTATGYGVGRFTIVTTRDAETEASFDRLASLPMVAGLAPLNRLVITEHLNSERDLRAAAASVQADMLLVYTFDTAFTSESAVMPLTVISLGLLPDREARVNCTATAALLDTRNGYVYGLAEGTSRKTQIANAWTSKAAVDSSRRKAEQQAFESLVAELEKTWAAVVARHGPPAPVAAGVASGTS